MSTPTLTYSPASTSSEDGERTIQVTSVVDMPANVPMGSMDFGGKPAGAMEDLPHIFEGSQSDLKLPALKRAEPMVVNGPIHLPPLSEAVPNPVLVERVLEPLPRPDGMSDISGPDFFSSFATCGALVLSTFSPIRTPLLSRYFKLARRTKCIAEPASPTWISNGTRARGTFVHSNRDLLRITLDYKHTHGSPDDFADIESSIACQNPNTAIFHCILIS
ncbi:hypothetical protein NM688_g3318 [Phlebia brevispora]|uniref:Uncharacterized protein n=1 Tax=Phlebia brevispora TaxID=194682 RepID=A0ACC1T5V8_9APHY|nr:hypothetical protein NM688_g3318 [Phlebia brevispora]